MTREPRRDHYIAPAVGDDTERVLEAAIASLAELRGFDSSHDAATTLHLLASLIAAAEARLPRAVAQARLQNCSWAEVADLLGVTRASAWQRFGATTQPSAREERRRKRSRPRPSQRPS
jgi:hypothetical protein